MQVGRAPGFASMMKDGARHMSGLEEAVFRNIEACTEFSETVSSAFGPNGMNKMVINHLEKMFVTSDAATIIRELEIEHPAAKMMAMAAAMMQQEVGDGTNFVVLFCGALLKEAEDLLRMGLKPCDVAEGYELALTKSLEVLDESVVANVDDLKKQEDVVKAIRTAVMSKLYGYEDELADLVFEACKKVMHDNGSFNVDDVRTVKILGGGLHDSEVYPGMIFLRDAVTTIRKVKDAKIAVYSCPFDIQTTETKGTVLITNADELVNFSKGEEEAMEKIVKPMAESGVNVIVSGGKIGDLALHMLEKYNIMGVRMPSKWDIRRVAKLVGATVLPKMTVTTADELGFADNVECEEIAGQRVTRFQRSESRISTILIRGSTDNFMDDVERAVESGINTYKALSKDKRLVSGAGAVEMSLSRKINSYSTQFTGLEQYAIQKFSVALQSVPRMLAENSGFKASACISSLLAAHSEGQAGSGLDVEEGTVLNATDKQILDAFYVKFWGIKYAVKTAVDILRIDQIIMAKPAGGPKPRDPGAGMDQDDD